MNTLFRSHTTTLRDAATGFPGENIRGSQSFLPLTLRRNFSWMFAGNLVSTGCRWGILVALTKLGSPEMVGSYALAMGICTPIFTLCNINLRSVQTVDTRSEFDFSSYFSLRSMTVLLAAAIVASFTLFSGYDKNMVMLILLVGVAKSLESLSDVFHGLFQRVERMDYSAKSLALNGILSVLSVSLALYFTHSLLAAMAVLAGAWLLLLVLFDLPCGLSILASEAEGETRLRDVAASFIRSVRARIGSAATFRLALVALPLGIGTFLCALNINIPRYLIVMYIGERELGYFAALASSTIAINLFVRALGTSTMPSLAKALDSGDTNKFLRYVVRATFVAFLVGAVAVCVASLWGKPLLAIVYQADYAAYSDLFIALMLVGTISAIATTLSLATTAAHLFRQQVVVYGLNTIFTLGACWFLVPRYALWGAVIALGAAAVLRIIFYVLLIGSVVRRHTTPLPSN
ncbi:MAG: oligosaccharide flippase family protein [Planctomycetes bacterium]|nr:oligosaccharide flippase family protein [Planctomycetota bacterium]